MRILFIRAYYFPRPGANHTAVSELGRGLAAHGMEVGVLCLGDGSDPDNDGPIAVLRIARPPVLRRLGRLERGAEQAWYLLAAAAVLLRQRNRWDRVVAVDTPTGITLVARLAALASRGRVRTVAWVLDLGSHQAAGLGIGSSLRRVVHGLRARVVGMGLRGVDDVVVLGTCMGRFVQRLGVPADHISFVPIWHRPLRPEGGEVAGSGQVTELVLRYSGTRHPRHPLDSVLAVAERFTGESQLRFEFVGSAERFGDVDVAAAKGAPVRRRDRVADSELSQLHTSTWIHVATLADGALGTCVPSKVYAAMAAGRPCLFVGPAECQSARDIVEFDAGWVVSQGDIDGLERLLRSLVASPHLVDAAADRAAAAFEQRSLSAALPRWLEVLTGPRPEAPLDRTRASPTDDSPPDSAHALA